jgi:hypothetical protein
MRLVKALQFIGLLILVTVLFGGEVLESACFIDDVSNDYIQAPASSDHGLTKKAPADVVPQSNVNFAQESIPNLAVILPVQPSHSSALTLLQLLCIQRK